MSERLFNTVMTLASSLVLLAGIAILWRRSLQAYIRAFARQSFCIVVAVLLLAHRQGDRELLFVGLMMFALKVVFIPAVLRRLQRHGGAATDVHPYINTPVSLAIAGMLTLVAYAVARPVVALSDLPTRGGLPLALASVFVGLLIVASRRSALSQIVGFLVMENGIALLAVLATYGVPLIVELGVFLDVLLGFLVMQIFVYRIRETFETTDVDRLRSLRH
jgi:hydrogenase-4 component E